MPVPSCKAEHRTLQRFRTTWLRPALSAGNNFLCPFSFTEEKTDMLTIIGFTIIFGGILGGFLLHGGNVAILYQISEFIILGCAAIGVIIAASNKAALKRLVRDIVQAIKGNPYTKKEFLDVLSMMFELFEVGKRDGLRALEKHLDQPEDSGIFRRYPFFLKNQPAVSFLTDTLKVFVGGAVPTHDLIETLETDVEQYCDEALRSSRTLRIVGDAMPGFGIVAAVLGVIITMGLMDKGAEQIGQGIASALVGTFLGVVSAYGIFHPLSAVVGNIAKAHIAYIECLRAGVAAFMRGANPITCVEFARRSIEPEMRPSFIELENTVRNRGGQG